MKTGLKIFIVAVLVFLIALPLGRLFWSFLYGFVFISDNTYYAYKKVFPLLFAGIGMFLAIIISTTVVYINEQSIKKTYNSLRPLDSLDNWLKGDIRTKVICLGPYIIFVFSIYTFMTNILKYFWGDSIVITKLIIIYSSFLFIFLILSEYYLIFKKKAIIALVLSFVCTLFFLIFAYGICSSVLWYFDIILKSSDFKATGGYYVKSLIYIISAYFCAISHYFIYKSSCPRKVK